jgi:hypothetical protein
MLRMRSTLGIVANVAGGGQRGAIGYAKTSIVGG